MSILTLLKLAERVIHPSSFDTPEGKIAAKLVNKVLDAEGCTLSALIYKTYDKTLPQISTTAKQFRAKIADLEAKQADLEAERDLALMAAQEAAEAVRQTVALEAEKAAWAGDKADLLAQAKALSEAALHNAAMAAAICFQGREDRSTGNAACRSSFHDGSCPRQSCRAIGRICR